MRYSRLLLVCLLVPSAACTDPGEPLAGTSTFKVKITSVNGAAPPIVDMPLPANRGDKDDTWDFEIEARSPYGEPISFEGMVRISAEPGTVTAVTGEGSRGRNILLKGGKAKGTASVTAAYGPARLWIEDLGYVPVPVGPNKPACSDGSDNDGDVGIDFPADPGCAYADDNTEEGGSFAAGISPAVHYALPTLRDIQGDGTQTPYPFEAVQINTYRAEPVIVTRVSSDGFYVTDRGDSEYNHMFAFNFSAPPGMRVCDRVTYLTGTVSEFFGFTELSFPSYKLDIVQSDEFCTEMPAPALLPPPIRCHAFQTKWVASAKSSVGACSLTGCTRLIPASDRRLAATSGGASTKRTLATRSADP